MRLFAALLPAAALSLALLSPGVASACGGTFCDSPPPNQPPMPVDQSGENILFVMEDGKVEAHVQIQYTGNPERFAWVVPVPKQPKITAGSQQLFVNLLGLTVPTFDTDSSQAACVNSFGSPSSDSGIGCGSSDAAFASADFGPTSGRGNEGSAGTGGSGPQVVGRASVGSYETVTLEGGTAATLIGWLNDNHYLVPPSTEKLLGSYLEQNYVFVAVKLSAGAGLNEIHPLVFTYEGTQPCVPLKLTAVAATENMGVRTFFLDQRRWAPLNYKHVVPNDLLFNWSSLGGAPINPVTGAPATSLNYEQIISRVVDTELAMGQAFLTEYAGSFNANLAAANLYRTFWNSKPFAKASREEAISLLKSQQLLTCGGGSCTSQSPLLFPLLEQFIPVPTGVDPNSFYSCLSCYPKANTTSWNPELFALELEERIFSPGKHAEQLVTSHPYLTRLFTTISPAEMTADPEFIPTDAPLALSASETVTSSGGVAQSRAATQQRQCDQSSVMIIGQREVALPLNSAWPDFSAMPTAERVEQYAADGSVTVLRDNTPEIDRQLALHNKANDWPPQTEFRTTSSGDTCALGPVHARSTARAFFAVALGALLLRRRRGA